MTAAVARVRARGAAILTGIRRTFLRLLGRTGGELVYLGAGCCHLGIQRVASSSGYRKRTLYLVHVALQWERMP